MEVNIVYPSRGFALQARSIEVSDVVRLTVEQVQDVQPRAPGLVELVGHSGFRQRTRARAHAVVFYQWVRAEVAQLERTRPRSQILDRSTEMGGQGDCARDVVSKAGIERVGGRKAGLGQTELEVEEKPG